MSFRRFTVLPSGIQQWKVFNWHFARAHPNGFFGVNGILHVWIKQPHLYNPVWIVVDYALCWSFFQIHTFKITAWNDPKITPFLHFRPSSNVVVETTTKENMCWPTSSVAHSQQHLPHNIAAFPAFFGAGFLACHFTSATWEMDGNGIIFVCLCAQKCEHSRCLDGVYKHFKHVLI